ncbi:MAG: 50S ribosomal protein P1 [Candidatus Aenigmatarchaeota archaeon]
MEYVQSAMLLHSADKEINEENITAVLEAAGVDVDEARVKSLVAALEDVDIDEAIESTAVPAGGAAPASTDEEEESEEKGAEEEESDEEEEEEGAGEEEAAEGLGSLFEE